MKIKTRLLALFLLLCLIVTPLVACNDDDDDDDTPSQPDTSDEFTGSIAGTDTENSGSQNTGTPTPPIAEGDENATVQITSYEDLKSKITQKGTFVLVNDIVIPEDFTPIGTYVYPFLGTFDGNDHKITLTVKQSAEGIGFSPTFKFVYCGLFGVLRDATVKNLSVDVKCAATSTTEYCFVLAGGVAGYIINSTVTNCTVTGDIAAKSEFFNAYCGNIAGVMQGGEIIGCNAGASVTAHDSQNRAVAGGIIGYAFDGANISTSKSQSAVKATSTNGIAYAGGLAGNTLHSAFTACGAYGDVYAEVLQYNATDKTHGAAFAGGVIGVAAGDSASKKAAFTRCYSPNGAVTAVGNDNTAYAAGIAASVTYASFVHCYSLSNVTLNTGLNLGFAASAFGSLNGANATNSDKSNVISAFTVDGCFASGNVSSAHSTPHKMFIGTTYGYIINDAALVNIKNAVYNNASAFTLNGSTPITLSKNGTAKPSDFFTLDSFITTLKWSENDWESDGSIWVAK